MHGRWQQGRLHHRNAPARFDEIHLVKPADLICRSDPVIELNQIRTQAKQHVLAVVHHLASSRMLVRGGASSEEWTPLE